MRHDGRGWGEYLPRPQITPQSRCPASPDVPYLRAVLHLLTSSSRAVLRLLTSHTCARLPVDVAPRPEQFQVADWQFSPVWRVKAVVVVAQPLGGAEGRPKPGFSPAFCV
jgi:hypothetical protein